MTCLDTQGRTAFATVSPGVVLTVVGDSATADVAVVDAPKWVSTFSAGPLLEPSIYQWKMLESNAVVAFGLAVEGTTEVFGGGLQNFYYLSDGRIVFNGAVRGEAPPVGTGDVVTLYVDGPARIAQFLLNGSPV
jgi:hypothetical protein